MATSLPPQAAIMSSLDQRLLRMMVLGRTRATRGRLRRKSLLTMKMLRSVSTLWLDWRPAMEGLARQVRHSQVVPSRSVSTNHCSGMCLGGHLAYRCAFDKRIRAAVCYFATDIHSHTLGEGKADDSLQRVKDIHGELIMIFGKRDNHVPPEGRDLIRKTLHEA